MRKNTGALLFNAVVAITLFAFGVFLCLAEEIAIPSPYGSSASHLRPPATYLVSALPLGMAILIFLRITLPDLAAKYGAWLFMGVIALFLLGYAIS